MILFKIPYVILIVIGIGVFICGIEDFWNL